MKYNIKNITPEKMQCAGAGCPSIYKGIKEVTMQCIGGTCEHIYVVDREGEKEGEKVYLVIGQRVDPSEAGLEGKVGKGECLIAISTALIDEMRK